MRSRVPGAARSHVAGWPSAAAAAHARLARTSRREDPLRTFTPRSPTTSQRDWHVIDAEGAVLGRVATEVATLLRGKHKPIWAPHVDTGDHVIVINASKLDISTRKKATDKIYYRHSGYPGGIKTERLERLHRRATRSGSCKPRGAGACCRRARSVADDQEAADLRRPDPSAPRAEAAADDRCRRARAARVELPA